MAIVYGKAPGKIILFGEHAVVYGQPAIAIPVSKVKATARIYPAIHKSQGWLGIEAKDINLNTTLSELPTENPINMAISLTLQKIKPTHTPAMQLQISSTIPIGGGMGSSAAISIAIIHALSSFLGQPFSKGEISDLAYEVEKIHHGTPSGIDNSVIAYQTPIYFQRKRPIEFLKISKQSHWVIADSGESTPTLETVAAVRAQYNANPEKTGKFLKKIGKITEKARFALENGDIKVLGELVNENQQALRELELSSKKIELLIKSARRAGAVGAKLSGGGRGGNIIALCYEENIPSIIEMLEQAGATRVFATRLAESEVS